MRHNKMKDLLNGLLCGLLALGIIGLSSSLVLAGEKEDMEAMEAMQKTLNQKVMERPFNPGDKSSLDAYLQDALKNGVPPPQLQPPSNWQPGWTCNKFGNRPANCGNL